MRRVLRSDGVDRVKTPPISCGDPRFTSDVNVVSIGLLRHCEHASIHPSVHGVSGSFSDLLRHYSSPKVASRQLHLNRTVLAMTHPSTGFLTATRIPRTIFQSAAPHRSAPPLICTGRSICSRLLCSLVASRPPMISGTQDGSSSVRSISGEGE